MLFPWIGSWEKNEGLLEPGQAARLGLISAAQIGREMAAWRTTGGKRRIAGAGLCHSFWRNDLPGPSPKNSPGVIQFGAIRVKGGEKYCLHEVPIERHPSEGR